MSTGALTQLAAIGSQDQYLSVQGEVTFFKGVYRRHTAFAQEVVEMQFNQSVAFGQQCSATISRTGDLLSKTWLYLELPALNVPLSTETDTDPGTGMPTFTGAHPGARYCDEVSHAIIERVDLVIGGTKIDSHPGHFLQVWNELTCTDEKKKLNKLIGKSGSEEELQDWAKGKQKLYIPLQFFFCRHLMQALPLIALQYHEVKIDVKFKQLDDIVPKWGPGEGTPAHGTFKSGLKLDAKLLCTMVYLEEEERRSYASSVHEYLIDLLQYQGEQDTTAQSSTTYHAFFNHPTTELIWCFVPQACLNAKEPFGYHALNKAYNLANDPLKTAKLQFNGYDRFSEMDAEYFREIVPAQVHTAIPEKNIYVYSFALEPEDFRPSGSVNLSRIDNVKLVMTHVDFMNPLTHPYNDLNGDPITAKGAKLRVYARSKNVLRIKAGMAGLAYAN